MPKRIEKPIRMKELERRFKPRPPRKETPIALERRFHVAADGEPHVKTSSTVSTVATATRTGR
jgi:hypothetical protein